MDNPVKAFFNDLKELVIAYVETRLQLTKVKAYEKLAKILAALFTGLVLLIVFFFVLIALTLMLATMLNAALNTQFGGYTIVAGIYLLGFILLVVNRKKWMEQYFMNMLIKILFEDENRKD